MPTKALEIKHTIKLINELTSEIEKIEYYIKKHNGQAVFPSLDHSWPQLSHGSYEPCLRLVILTILIHLTKFYLLPGFLLPHINPVNVTIAIPTWKNSVRDTL